MNERRMPMMTHMDPHSTATRGNARSGSPVRLAAVLTVVALLLAACSSTGVPSAEPERSSTPEISPSPLDLDSPEYGATLDEFLDGDRPEGTPPPDGFAEIDWDDLVPPGFSNAEISARFDERIAEVEPGSPEADEVFAELDAEYANQPVNDELAGDAVQLAGFVAPLTYSGDTIVEFLLVPYFGACIHVPPPPVNQTVMVNLQDGQGLTTDEAWGTVWVAGTLTIDGTETDIGSAGYSITDATTGVYNSEY